MSLYEKKKNPNKLKEWENTETHREIFRRHVAGVVLEIPNRLHDVIRDIERCRPTGPFPVKREHGKNRVITFCITVGIDEHLKTKQRKTGDVKSDCSFGKCTRSY